MTIFSIVVRELVWHSRLVRLSFRPFTLINGLLTLGAIILGFQLAALPFPGLGWVVNAQLLIVGVLVTLGVTLWTTANRFLGVGTLGSPLTGRYHHPIRRPGFSSPTSRTPPRLRCISEISGITVFSMRCSPRSVRPSTAMAGLFTATSATR